MRLGLRVGATGADVTVGADSREVVASREPAPSLPAVGVLARSWNVHPKGSPVLAETTAPAGAFVIVDVPSSE